mmetsp:Transcript_6720/g.14480  ORF Transcript_6720/g.14480 Transcript_6720/m.14480 type:complete len:235 (+) Transcript_6720:453-1157(+)
MYTHDAPSHSHVPIGIVSVQRKPIVQIQADLQRRLRIGRPLQHLFRPVHAQKSVHPSGLHQLDLRRVPQVVVRLRRSELFFGINVFPGILAVQLQAVARPSRCAGKGVIPVGLVPAEVVRELPTHDALLQKGRHIRAVLLEGADRERHSLEGYVAVVDPGAHSALDVLVGVVARSVVMAKARIDEGLQLSLGLCISRYHPRYTLYSCIGRAVPQTCFPIDASLGQFCSLSQCLI